MEEPFQLQQPKRERKLLNLVLTDTTRQGVLFTGADCLPGQQELFDGAPDVVTGAQDISQERTP